jgi:hypothetical protein
VSIKNPSELGEYAADLTYAFPDILSLARGFDQTGLIPKAIVFHPTIRRLLNDFGGIMVRVDALRLNPDAESQAHVTYRAIADVMNRFVEMERFEASIEKILTIHQTSSCFIRS